MVEVNHNRNPMEVLGYATPEDRHFIVFRNPLMLNEEAPTFLPCKDATQRQKPQCEKAATDPVPSHQHQERELEEEEDNEEEVEEEEDNGEEGQENCCNVTTTQLEELRKFANAYKERHLEIQKKNAMLYAKRVNQRDVPAPFPPGTEIVFTPPRRGQSKGKNIWISLYIYTTFDELGIFFRGIELAN